MAQILVVDDESSIRDLLRTILEADSHEVTEAADGAEALTRIERQMPDLILLDLNMPGMHGWRFLDELYTRGLREQTRVIVLSAMAELRPPQNVPSKRVVAKPFDIEALLVLIRETLAEEPRVLHRSTDRSASLARLIDHVDSIIG